MKQIIENISNLDHQCACAKPRLFLSQEFQHSSLHAPGFGTHTWGIPVYFSDPYGYLAIGISS